MLPLYKVIKSDHLVEKTTTLSFPLRRCIRHIVVELNNQLTPK